MNNIYQLIPASNMDDLVDQAIVSLSLGRVIAVPTDTIYGVAALAQSPSAVEQIYEIKHRHREKAIAICVGTVQQVKRWGKVTISDEALSDLLPGPVTLVFERSPLLYSGLNPATDSIGIRIPDSEFIKRLAHRCEQPIALTSANLSAGKSPRKVTEFSELWPQLDMIVDGGVLGQTEESRLGSTVVDLSTPGEFMIIRDGCAYRHVVNILQNKYKLKNKERTS